MKFGLDSIIENKVRIITFCNTKRKNALSPDAYNEITNILNHDAKNDNIIATIFTGKDEYFTSGNDLSVKVDEDFDFEKASNDMHGKFVRMVDALLKYPKLIISVVNGPAIGIGFTLTGLSDIVYASETATFSAPFVKLGLCIEGCGSYMLPRIMGRSKATEILLLGHKLNAQEAVTYNLVANVYKKHEIPQVIDKLVVEISKLPLEPIMFNKKLITDNINHDLFKCAEREATVLYNCQTSELFLNNLMEFMTRKKSKL